ncbi:MAG: kelch repeat-containing protein [Candidatus Thorarchaeota archaeon]|nr:kelch repeat-containing protein [Candidatus Thorarchaeota archaeon]
MNRRKLNIPALLATCVLLISTFLGPATIVNTSSHTFGSPSYFALSQDEVSSSLEAALVYDSESDRFIRYGGWISVTTSPGFSNVVEFSDETWSYDLNENEWTNQTTSVNPGPKAGCAAAYDSQSDRIIIYGGRVSETSAIPEELYSGDTWAYDYNANSWTNMSPANAPGIRYGAGMVYDSESDVIILFGGMNFPSLNGYHVQQTWAYDFETNTWTNLEPAVQPIGRHHMGITYDVESDRVIMFGGYVSSALDHANGDTWAYDYNSNTWELMEPDRFPLGRFYGSMSYDNITDVTILYGGASEFANNAVLGETWSYDYNNDEWFKMEADPHPPARWRQASAYDTKTGIHVMIGGSYGDIFGGEAREDICWTYNHTNDEWTNQDGSFDPDTPGPPENLLVINEGYGIFLTWEMPVNDTGYAISGYRIYRGTGGDLALLAETDSVLIYPDNDVMPGVTYYYSITAFTPAGEGEPSQVFAYASPVSLPIVEISIGIGVSLILIVAAIRWKRQRYFRAS